MSSAGAPLIPVADPSVVQLPKVSLHDHLDGGVRADTLFVLAGEAGLTLPSEAGASSGALAEWIERACDSGSLEQYLETFSFTTAIMQTREGLSRVAREAVLDLASDGVIWSELRWAPELHVHRGLSLSDAVEAVQAGIDEGIDQAAEQGHAIGVGQLLTAMRQADRAAEVAELALAKRGEGVVGFDLAGPEAGFPASRFADVFRKLTAELMPITVHAGEGDGLESIRGAIVDGRALRLGHGVRIAEDIQVLSSGREELRVSMGELAEYVRDRQLPLELSPSSNLQTGAVAAWGKSMGEHPFDLLYQLGFNVTVNTDNRLMSRTSLSLELERLADAFGYTLEDLEQFQLNAAAAAFCPLEEREALQDAIIEGFAAAE